MIEYVKEISRTKLANVAHNCIIININQSTPHMWILEQLYSTFDLLYLQKGYETLV
jgi:hypothetical protein